MFFFITLDMVDLSCVILADSIKGRMPQSEARHTMHRTPASYSSHLWRSWSNEEEEQSDLYDDSKQLGLNLESPLTSDLTSSDWDDPGCHGDWQNKCGTPMLHPSVSE
ncbi:unnamed protein product [Pleuronectes platessa]|uniref:Uncharacterized protein n=1 Tax=Pleuronectes platessa TaxID=8262 RepID=A0A9N7UGH8_PLEPL|nr:unnamed protein product [Pleuronectes platessa]